LKRNFKIREIGLKKKLNLMIEKNKNKKIEQEVSEENRRR
jgi:hypothetical protein